jgi:hypothetical protein
VDVVVTLALAAPVDGVSAGVNGRVLLELPVAPDLASRVAALWGDERRRASSRRGATREG